MVPNTPVPMMPPEPRRAEVLGQILVIEGAQLTPYIIEARDEVTTTDGAAVGYPDEVMRILTGEDPELYWVDVWQDGQTPEGQRTRLRRRIFARNITSLIESTVFPPEANMVQS